MTKARHALAAALVGGSLVFAACGDDGDTTTGDDVPAPTTMVGDDQTDEEMTDDMGGDDMGGDDMGGDDMGGDGMTATTG